MVEETSDLKSPLRRGGPLVVSADLGCSPPLPSSSVLIVASLHLLELHWQKKWLALGPCCGRPAPWRLLAGGAVGVLVGSVERTSITWDAVEETEVEFASLINK